MGDSQDVYLALDQGTHSSRVMVFDEHGHSLAAFQESVGISYPDAVAAEQDADEILQSLVVCLASSLCAARDNHWRVRAAGLATQRSSVVAWNRATGESLSPVISWQDRREHQYVETLRDREAEIRQRTGLPLTPHYGASKIRWLLKHCRAVVQCAPQELGIGPLASFLIAKLTEPGDDGLSRYLVDHTNALRTQLMNLQELDWDQHLLDMFDLPSVRLPQCVSVLHDFGHLSESPVSEASMSGAPIPLLAVSGDQTAAMFGQGAFPEHTAMVNLGTGGFVLMPDGHGEHSDPDLLGGLSISDDESCEYLSEGTVNGCGSATKWAAERLNVSADELKHADDWFSECASPPVFVNLVGGVGSPWWIQLGESYWCDMGGNRISAAEVSSQAGMVAVLESIVFLICANLRRIAKHSHVTDLRISGGLSQLDGVCHRLANLSGCRVTRAAQIEATASGVAWMAAGRPNHWQQNGESTLFVPDAANGLKDRYDVFVSQLERLSQ